MERVRPGRHFPLGATSDGEGVNFAIFSEHARGVTLCLFDAGGKETRIPLSERTQHVWHAYVAGVAPGQLYGYRVDGPWEPARGMRFNPNKLLVDPYARAVSGKVDPRGPVSGHAAGDPSARCPHDSAPFVPRSIVMHDLFDWEGDRRPDVHWHDTILYEAHAKGLSRANRDVPEALRGTYAGIAHEATISHLCRLGITALELLPVHEIADEIPLARRGGVNYWGYSTLAFFAPEQRYAPPNTEPGGQVRAFKEMVRALHRANIEVVLDVVYNHTCEGDRAGPTLSLRGIDNAVYYRLSDKDPSVYEDFTGCGNSLNVAHAQTLKLIMDSLRYWVTEMHVDGFRFDLASTLARDAGFVDKLSSFFDIIHQDPVLSRVKLVAEPWDLGHGGYQVGNFPILWTEWNGHYRDATRRFWRGERARVGEMGYRLTGSSDLYEPGGRRPQASINLITAHDGFTLRDLVTYEKKRNLANGEDNRDGWDDNLSWNCGVEGETDDAKVNALRARQTRNFLATLLLSQGVPMITSGDEMGKTQGGNNNAYVQDNEISWVGFDLDARRKELLAFACDLVLLRKRHAVFRRPSFLRGDTAFGAHGKDVAWFSPRGEEMTVQDWQRPETATLGLLLAGDALGIVDDLGRPVVDDTFFLVFSACSSTIRFTLPPRAWGETWVLVFDTTAPSFDGHTTHAAAETVDVGPFSTVVLRRARPERGSWRPPPPDPRP
jgi:glycogen operon protein